LPSRSCDDALLGGRTQKLLRRLDEIEKRIVPAKLPASFADQLYVLRQHLHFVRNQIVQPGNRRGVSSTPVRPAA
jgi:uncharacterized protein